MKKTETTSTVLVKHHLKALRLPTILSECEKVAQRCATDSAVSVRRALGLSTTDDFESAVLERLRRFIGQRLGAIAAALGIPRSTAKSNTALIVRRAVGISDDRARILEFEQHGIEVKTVPLAPSGSPACFTFRRLSFCFCSGL